MGNKNSQEENKNNNNHDNNNNNEINVDNMSYWQMAKLGYQELVNAIIRPPRAEYTMNMLGPTNFEFGGKRFERIDFILQNDRNLNISCSHWRPVNQTHEQIPCLIYMHGNSSAKIECLPTLSTTLAIGASLFAFDFCGSGLSDGEYVSLGFYERDDLAAVIEHLRNEGRTSTIALWGRSMGAATALMHGERDPSIAAMVLDSPFASLSQLAEELVAKGKEHGYKVPNFIVTLALKFIRSSVQSKANFDIKKLSPISHAESCFIPAMFVAASNDDFIPPHHSESIHHIYGGDKNLIIVEGDHNSRRPAFLFDSAGIFLQQYLQIDDSLSLTGVVPSLCHGLPPWSFNSQNRSNEILSIENIFLNEYLQTDLGMTNERQLDIQNTVNRMLGSQTNINNNKNDDFVNFKEWECARCTLINQPNTRKCIVCGFNKNQSINTEKNTESINLISSPAPTINDNNNNNQNNNINTTNNNDTTTNNNTTNNNNNNNNNNNGNESDNEIDNYI